MDLGETALVRVTESLPSLHFLLPLSDLFTLICIQLCSFGFSFGGWDYHL